MRFRPLRTAVIAGALTLSTAAGGVSVAGAAPPRPQPAAHHANCAHLPGATVQLQLENEGSYGVDTVRRATEELTGAATCTQIVGDDSYRMARYVEVRDGVEHVVFAVRSLHTGSDLVLNAA